ncbi:MAG TPA: cyclodeaminase/cyclohydrolase family protein [Syntrophobacteraceae bacterium]|nr:cyclodeaminase/cyclohydrolase family protein [Syntrophobacteraceae bacterium]
MNEPFLVALANPEPNPGGGAAAGYSACLGVALVKKILRLELLRSRTSPELTSLWQNLLKQANEMEQALERLIEEDGRAYLEFVEARTDCGRQDFSDALEKAVECPVKIMKQSGEGLGLISEIAKRCGRHLLSDLLVSGESFLAAVKGAYHIAWANICLLPGNSAKKPITSTGQIMLLEQSCRQKHMKVQEQLEAGIRGERRNG